MTEHGLIVTNVPADTTLETLDPAVREIIDYSWRSSKAALLVDHGVDLGPYEIKIGPVYSTGSDAAFAPRPDEIGRRPVGWYARGDEAPEGLVKAYLTQGFRSL